MRSWRGVVLAVLASLAAHGQARTASLKGIVKDPLGNVIAGVRIQLESGPEQWSAQANDRGFYEFSGLSAGNYTALFQSPGFHSAHKSVRLRSGEFQLDVVLEVPECAKPRFSLIRMLKWPRKTVFICE